LAEISQGSGVKQLWDNGVGFGSVTGDSEGLKEDKIGLGRERWVWGWGIVSYKGNRGIGKGG